MNRTHHPSTRIWQERLGLGERTNGAHAHVNPVLAGLPYQQVPAPVAIHVMGDHGGAKAEAVPS